MLRKNYALLVLILVFGLAFVYSSSQAQQPVSPRDNPDFWPRLSGVVMVEPVYSDLLWSPPPALNLERIFGFLEDVPVGPNVRANQDTTVQAQNEPSIAVNPTNPYHIVGSTNDYRLRQSGGDVRAGYYASFDGGHTWPGDGIIDISSIPNTFAAGDPAMAIYDTSHVYYAYIAFNRNVDDAGGVFVSRSTDGGLTWLAPVAVAWNSLSVFHDKEYIAVDDTGGPYDGNVYVTWTRFEFGDPIYFSRSTNQGQTWSNPVQISSSFSTQGSLPRVGPGGVLYVAWYDYTSQIWMTRSLDGGQTFAAPFLVATIDTIPSPLPGGQFRDNSFPAFAIDQTTGSLYVAWSDYRNGDADIYYTRSTDGGANWSPEVRLNTDPLHNNAHQFFPWMDVAPNGKLYIGWFDSRQDPSPLVIPLIYDEYVTASEDGGLTFSPETRITEVSSNSNIGPFSSPFIGDYSGLAATDSFVFPMWVDTRNGHQDGYTQALPILVDALKQAPALVERSQPFTYTLSILPAEDMLANTLADPLPAGVSFVPGSLYASSGSASFDGNTVNWAGDLTAGSPLTVTFSVTPTAYCETSLVNTAVFTSSLGSSLEMTATSLISGTLVDPSFTYSASSLTITFTNQTTSPYPLEFGWDFGDGMTSTQPNPVHTYALPGTYDVTLQASDLCGATGFTAPVQVSCPAPQAFFTWQADLLQVDFTNQSSGTLPLSYLWSFGDGTTSTELSPSHLYSLPGLYTVALTASEACGVDGYAEDIRLTSFTYLPVTLKH